MAENPSELVLAAFGAGSEKVQQFAQLLQEEGILRGLIGPKETERIWSRHLVNSAAVAGFLPDSGTVADVGSGAGLPGIVLACMRPDLEFFLVEPMERRCDWLNYVKEQLDLTNVQVIRSRSEDLPADFHVDAVTARAVAGLAKLLRLTSKLLGPKGCLVALKGRRASEEVAAAKKELSKLRLTAKVHEVPSLMEEEATYVVQCCRRD